MEANQNHLKVEWWHKTHLEFHERSDMYEKDTYEHKNTSDVVRSTPENKYTIGEDFKKVFQIIEYMLSDKLQKHSRMLCANLQSKFNGHRVKDCIREHTVYYYKGFRRTFERGLYVYMDVFIIIVGKMAE